MLSTMAAVMLASLALTPQSADTTFAVDANGRLELRNVWGSAVVDTWDRAEMRIDADLETDARLEIRRSGSEIIVSAEGEYGEPVNADYRITIPRSMSVELNGVELEAEVTGVGGSVAINTVEGYVTVSGGNGNVAVNAVDGDVSVENASGNIAVNAVDGDVMLSNIDGVLSVQTVDGEIQMTGISSNAVEASTVDGDITYQGRIEDDGRYFLSTHDGDITVTVQDGANARVSVATFSGELEADFPIRMEGDIGRKRFSFTLGNGSALLELSAFDGTISLVRP